MYPYVYILYLSIYLYYDISFGNNKPILSKVQKYFLGFDSMQQVSVAQQITLMTSLIPNKYMYYQNVMYFE